MSAQQHMATFSCVGDLENLFQKFELPFWVKEGIRFVQENDAVAVFEEFDDGIDVDGLELAVAKVGDVGI